MMIAAAATPAWGLVCLRVSPCSDFLTSVVWSASVCVFVCFVSVCDDAAGEQKRPHLIKRWRNLLRIYFYMAVRFFSGGIPGRPDADFSVNFVLFRTGVYCPFE